MINTKNNLANPVIQNRFSLVEILVAIAIIAVLLGLSGAGYTAVQRKIARTRTEATLNKLRVGLESFKSKYGYYPQQAAVGPFPFYIVTLSTRTVLGVTTAVSADSYFDAKYSFAPFTEASKIKNEDAKLIPPNITLPTGTVVTVVGGVTYTYLYNLKYDLYYIIDGWKTNISGNGSDDSGPFILYMCPGLVNTSSYDLFSAGNDRQYKWSSTTEVTHPVNTDNIWPQGLKTK